MLDKDRTPYTAAFVASLLCLAIYLRALTCGFVNYDDPKYVFNNPALKLLDWQFIAESFTTSYMGWWMPLTWISLAVDYRFWGDNAFGYHLTNIVIHTINTGLVALIADRLVGRVPLRHRGLMVFFAAVLWGIHPLRVESVAWVTERKDVLNGFFSLGGILWYLHWMSGEAKATRYYLLSVLFFFLGLMAKPSSVVLPAVFLILDWYPLQRLHKGTLRGLFLEKVPFFAVALAVAAATVLLAQGETILVSLADHPLSSRILIAGFALVEYLRMSVWPAGLTHFYPIRPELPATYYCYTAVAVFLTIYAFYRRRQRPWLAASWMIYVLLLIPVLGLFQNGDQSHADRFTYLPMVLPTITVAVLIVVALEKLAEKTCHNRIGPIAFVIGATTTGLAFLSCQQIGYWRDSGTLWSRLIAVNPVGRAFYYRGDFYLHNGNYEAAAADLATAVQIAKATGNPEIFNLHALHGYALSRVGRYAEAVDEYTAAIDSNPQPNYFYHRGVALNRLGRTSDAEKDFYRAGNDTGPIQWIMRR